MLPFVCSKKFHVFRRLLSNCETFRQSLLQCVYTWRYTSVIQCFISDMHRGTCPTVSVLIGVRAGVALTSYSHNIVMLQRIFVFSCTFY